MARPSKTPKNIILIGFMGSGKSSIARELSHTLGYPVVDTDGLIVEITADSPLRGGGWLTRGLWRVEAPQVLPFGQTVTLRAAYL